MSYARDTDVPVARSRAEIDQLLIRWGCDAIQWSDDFRAGTSTLRFQWSWKGTTYLARLAVRAPTEAEVRPEFKKVPTKADLQRRREQRFRSLHRLLLLKIKADLNAVEAGLGTAFEVFLPHLESPSGRTVAELAVENLPRLLQDRS